MIMEFKKLEIKQEGSWFKRNIWTTHGKRTLIYILMGAMGGFLYFYLSEGINQNNIEKSQVIKSLMIGGFVGFFVTNSPCARGRC